MRVVGKGEDMKVVSQRIEQVEDKGNSRCGTYLDAEAEVLVATDGRMIAVVPTSLGDGDTSGRVPNDAIRAARKAKVGYVKCNGNVIVATAGGPTSFERPDDKFPDWKQVDIPRPSGPSTVTLDADFLHRLSKALRADGRAGGVRLFIEAADKPIYVEPSDGNGSHGLLMPMNNTK